MLLTLARWFAQAVPRSNAPPSLPILKSRRTSTLLRRSLDCIAKVKVPTASKHRCTFTSRIMNDEIGHGASSHAIVISFQGCRIPCFKAVHGNGSQILSGAIRKVPTVVERRGAAFEVWSHEWMGTEGTV